MNRVSNKDFFVDIEFAKHDLKKKKRKGQKEVHNFNFYRSGKFLDYIARNEAVIKEEYVFDKEVLLEGGVKAQDYFKPSNFTKNDSSGVYELFCDSLTPINIKQKKQELKKIKKEQIIWEMTLNPGEFGSQQLMYDRDQWNQLLNKHLKNLLKFNGINANNIQGYWALHTNTPFPHVHLSFYEKECDYFSKNGEVVFNKKAKIEKHSLKRFRQFFINDIKESDKVDYNSIFEDKKLVWELRRDINKQTKEFNINETFKNSIISEDVKDIQLALVDVKNKSYKKVDEEIKSKIWNVFNFIKDYDSELKLLYDNYNKKLDEIKNKSFSDNHHQQLRDDFLKKEFEEFELQVGNLVIKMCLKELSNNKDNQNLQNQYQTTYDNYFNSTKQNKEDDTKHWFFKKQKQLRDQIAFEEYQQEYQKQYLSNKLSWLLNNWEWEANGILFKQKIEALDRFRSGEVLKGNL